MQEEHILPLGEKALPADSTTTTTNRSPYQRPCPPVPRQCQKERLGSHSYKKREQKREIQRFFERGKARRGNPGITNQLKFLNLPVHQWRGLLLLLYLPSSPFTWSATSLVFIKAPCHGEPKLSSGRLVVPAPEAGDVVVKNGKKNPPALPQMIYSSPHLARLPVVPFSGIMDLATLRGARLVSTRLSCWRRLSAMRRPLEYIQEEDSREDPR